MIRPALWSLLAVVAAAAAVLSFATLRDLAVLCGFSGRLAWLLPLVVDAGAAAGCLACLGTPGDISGQLAGRFARALTIVLLAASVGGNAVEHGLAAYSVRPPWWLVVAVSAVAPAVLGAVVHLAVLTTQSGTEIAVSPADARSLPPSGEDTPDPPDSGADRAAELAAAGAGRRRIAAELGITEHQVRKLLASRNGHGR